LGLSHVSSNGPDWEDIQHALETIGGFHGASLSLTIQLAGARAAGHLEIIAVATTESALRGDQLRSVSRKHLYPNGQSRSLEGAMFKLLYELDKDCGSFWGQREMIT